jgi:hypothetical protein
MIASDVDGIDAKRHNDPCDQYEKFFDHQYIEKDYIQGSRK